MLLRRSPPPFSRLSPLLYLHAYMFCFKCTATAQARCSTWCALRILPMFCASPLWLQVRAGESYEDARGRIARKLRSALRRAVIEAAVLRRWPELIVQQMLATSSSPTFTNFLHAHIHAHTQMYTCTRIGTCANTQTHTHTCTHIHTRTQPCVEDVAVQRAVQGGHQAGHRAHAARAACPERGRGRPLAVALHLAVLVHGAPACAWCACLPSCTCACACCWGGGMVA